MAKSREKSIIVLEALLLGQTVNLCLIDGQVSSVYLNEDKELCLKGYQIKNNMKIDVELPLDSISLDEFIRICDKLSDNEIFSIVSSTTLIRSKTDRRQKGK